MLFLVYMQLFLCLISLKQISLLTNINLKQYILEQHLDLQGLQLLQQLSGLLLAGILLSWYLQCFQDIQILQHFFHQMELALYYLAQYLLLPFTLIILSHTTDIYILTDILNLFSFVEFLKNQEEFNYFILYIKSFVFMHIFKSHNISLKYQNLKQIYKRLNKYQSHCKNY
ncbi:transmembrane protein, putative (macronuclear) [Tetrahymena thermophila SB210]|uniref:Transmembrane protein, putative n=1 Tax=Tetrahymena thermophila (strain SB210) TaxID=312017 RepID=W7XJJ8_TETTS|nr:transmembrane protein, putative [Tetrahymena thermophila SB210]EWS74219.1 transmembrane protein, putative [Tetrahymena thermophila SB210]|eukprot:XP_012653247.1 transmembrane protein, putative [Tetrahymena thermophila SB210]